MKGDGLPSHQVFRERGVNSGTVKNDRHLLISGCNH